MNSKSYKILFIGNSHVGKTSLLNRYSDDVYVDRFTSTIGTDFKIKVNNGITLQLWDTAGQERFKTITSVYYRKADGIIIVYDVTCLKSFESIENWIEIIAKNTDVMKTNIMLLGNKSEHSNALIRQVKFEIAEKFAKNHNMLFFEVSAKENTNINISIETLIKTIQSNLSPYPSLSPHPSLSPSLYLFSRAIDEESSCNC